MMRQCREGLSDDGWWLVGDAGGDGQDGGGAAAIGEPRAPRRGG